MTAFRFRALAIELCQIIHRAGLTQESIEALLLAADVLKLIIEGAREQLQANMQAKIKGMLILLVIIDFIQFGFK